MAISRAAAVVLRRKTNDVARAIEAAERRLETDRGLATLMRR